MIPFVLRGNEKKKICFWNLLTFKDETFLEDISMVLNTGEVPNLFITEEKTEILERVQVRIFLYFRLESSESTLIYYLKGGS